MLPSHSRQTADTFKLCVEAADAQLMSLVDCILKNDVDKAIEDTDAWIPFPAALAAVYKESEPARSLFKHRLHPAENVYIPTKGCPCSIYYILRRVSTTGAVIVSTTMHAYRKTLVGGVDEPAKISLLHCNDAHMGAFNADDPLSVLPRGAHVAISTMAAGEVSRFLWQSAAEWFVLDVGLISWEIPLPPVPPRSVIQAQEVQLAEMDRKRMEADPPPALLVRLQDAMTLKHEGNQQYSAGNYQQAKELYDRGFAKLFVSEDEMKYSQEFVGEDAAINAERIRYARATLFLNRCVANLKRGALDDALWDADQAIQQLTSAASHGGLNVPAKTLEAELHLLTKGAIADLPYAALLCKAYVRKSSVLLGIVSTATASPLDFHEALKLLAESRALLVMAGASLSGRLAGFTPEDLTKMKGVVDRVESRLVLEERRTSIHLRRAMSSQMFPQPDAEAMTSENSNAACKAAVDEELPPLE